MNTSNFMKTAFVVAVSGGLLLVHTGTAAQATMALPRAAVMRIDGPTMQEQMTQMAAKIQALESRLAADEKKLHDVSDTADQAKGGITFINIGMGKQLSELQSSVGQYQNNTNGVIAGLGQQLDTLKGRFDTHTHTYEMRSIKANNVKIDGDWASLIVGNTTYPQTCSPPSN